MNLLLAIARRRAWSVAFTLSVQLGLPEEVQAWAEERFWMAILDERRARA